MRSTTAVKITLVMLVAIISARPAIGELATAIAVVQTVSVVSGLMSGGSGSNVLSAIAQNLATINRGLQEALKELEAVKDEVHRLPQSMYEHTLFRNLTGNYQAMIELRSHGEETGPLFNKTAYYRDVFDLYTKARTARQQLLNLDYEVSENGALHLPLIYSLEAWTYHELMGARTGREQEPLAIYFVNPTAWQEALRQYLKFYNTALDRERPGSLRDDWIKSYDVPVQIVKRSAPDIAEQLSTRPSGYTACYGVSVGWDGVSTYEGDGDRTDEWWELFDMYARTYTYHYNQSDLSTISKSEELVDSKIAVHRYPHDFTKYWEQYGCDTIMISDTTPDKLSTIDLSALEAAALRTDFLEAVDKLNDQAAKIIAKEAKVMIGPNVLDNYSRLVVSLQDITR